MTEEEFMEQLSEIRKDFVWEVTDHCILAFPKENRSVAMCPITAVATATFGQIFRLSQYMLAAEKLEIEGGPEGLANRIALASGRMIQYHKDTRPLRVLRAKLLKALKLGVV